MNATLDLAHQVIEEDKAIDRMESEVEKLVVRIIAPARTDGRRPARGRRRGLRSAAVIERIGDYAKNIAKRVGRIEGRRTIEPLSILPAMAEKANEMVADVLTAFAARDAAAALQVCDDDEVVDDFYNSIFRALVTHMMEDPKSIGDAAHLLFVAKNLERVGDHATNVAEMVYFNRHRPLHGRPQHRRRRVSAPTMRGASLLLVEDDDALAELITYTFAKEGVEVTHTPSGEEALVLVSERKPDLILLDWMVEGLSGIEVCRQLRRSSDTAAVPVIMLTARGEETDRLRGFETGADDYVTKPFSPKELIARAQAVLRRARPALTGETLTYADIEMDTVTHRVRRGGKAVTLGPTEYRLLALFAGTSRLGVLA